MLERSGKNGRESVAANFTPNPVESTMPLVLDIVTRYRNIWCSWYNQCLDQAAEGRWLSFSCRKCEGFTQPGSDKPPYLTLNNTYSPVEEIPLGRLPWKKEE